MVLATAIASMVMGGKTWIDGTARTTANDSSERAIRFISDQLQSSMSVVVDGDGQGITYQTPTMAANGNYQVPVVWDGVNRRIALTGGNLVVTTGGSTRTLVKSVVTTDPSTGTAYRIFTPGAGTVVRALTVMVVTRQAGKNNEYRRGRYRESVYLRNIPELIR